MTGTKLVERQSGIALWRQIADRMRLSINNGEFDGTGMMPPEKTLAERFGVNRHTVRSALAALADEGIVRPLQGIGTRIERRDRLSFPIARRTRFSQGLGGQARELDGKLIGWREQTAGQTVAEGLAITPDSRCICLETLHSADGRPVSRATNYFPADRFAAIAEEYRTHRSITKALAASGVADYVRRSTEISAAHAGGEDLADLRLSPGAILLVTIAVNVDMDGVPIQYARTRFAADRVKFTVDT
ncbi:phosphonate metabolism transcriptional regulator PhnF [Rhizobium sp. TRM95111]|uniref:phosphonate metabolism transcriptional regulator PhnF n=1 Tax=Rhizobium alarense TaxID=2846851 RepID=UPI001F3E139E|nr:phosphonate metabolism transcriptional regulator PhnF [Rhizobium alarense]MCF3640848.1 phosphonate metabolism transcriptional regulator PhnF [Rhizobium alarense]